MRSLEGSKWQVKYIYGLNNARGLTSTELIFMEWLRHSEIIVTLLCVHFEEFLSESESL